MSKYLTNNKERLIRKKYRGKANFRIVGSELYGYKLVISRTNEATYKELKAKEKMLEKIFNVEIVNFK